MTTKDNRSEFERRLTVILRDHDIKLMRTIDGRVNVLEHGLDSNRGKEFKSLMQCADHYCYLLQDDRLTNLCAATLEETCPA